jgi:SAM-dependent methyltransferase
MNEMAYNKVCCIEDFSEKEIREIIRDVFQFEISGFPVEYQDGIPDSKQWETAMCIRTFNNHNILNRDAVVLGVGSGVEILPFYLTRHVKEVFCTDLYLNAGKWSNVAPYLMMLKPEECSPIPFERERLVVQHMDGRKLNYRDETFDAIYSSGSIEHFGGATSIANSAYEMGRVLKPNGILSISTEFKISGPADGIGWEKDTFLFTQESLKKFVIEASGTEPIDKINYIISDSTMRTRRNLDEFLAGSGKGNEFSVKIQNYPNLILYHQGYTFCSIHLALRKKIRSAITNEWAKPDDKVIRDINRRNGEAIKEQSLLLKNIITPWRGNATDRSPHIYKRDDNELALQSFRKWQQLRSAPDEKVQKNNFLRNRKLLGFLFRTLLRVRNIGRMQAEESILFEYLIESHHKLLNNLEMFQSHLESIAPIGDKKGGKPE